MADTEVTMEGGQEADDRQRMDVDGDSVEGEDRQSEYRQRMDVEEDDVESEDYEEGEELQEDQVFRDSDEEEEDDRISKLEIISMAKAMSLEVDGCRFYWMDHCDKKKGLKEIKNDQDAMEMALRVDGSRYINVYAKVCKIDGINDQEADAAEEWLMEETEVIKEAFEAEEAFEANARECLKRKEVEEDEDSDFDDSDYNCASQEEQVDVDNLPRTKRNMAVDTQLDSVIKQPMSYSVKCLFSFVDLYKNVDAITAFHDV
ncbi:hypothetical protein J5N97_027616 [Dioscorea zingiberensis]|uniref:Uncharacterized protein n=1 Tax=Dioscorea zingiberensis TaxID=325984 RepID=A0A9D5H450_9LILI|nr:hypothetical protein J5N97_027616 [Dioscorea zingiberensis]